MARRRMKYNLGPKVLIHIQGLGLKEAKELVEGAPVVLQSSEVAEQTKEKLVALGAVIEIV